MSLVVAKKVRLLLGAGAAKPGPAIGQALGPLGLNMVDFCKQFNDQTKGFEKDTPTPVLLTAYTNRSFEFKIKTPPTSWFLKKCAGITKCTGKPGHEVVGKVHIKHIYEIALVKQQDDHMKSIPLRSIARMVAASAGTMGIDVEK